MFDFPEDVARIARVLNITEEEAEKFWSDYSDSMFAGWLCLPHEGAEGDATILKIFRSNAAKT
jgi:hypothetical protein